MLLDELDDLSDLRDEIRNAIVDEPPFSVREGGMIRDGYSEELDQLRDIVSGGKGDAESKIEAMKKAGIIVADSPAGLGEAVLKAIKG